jgi:hypothetical protein
MTIYENNPKIDLRDLTDDLIFEFNDLPLDVLTHYIRRSIITMCREADLVRRTPFITTQPGVGNYSLDLEDDLDLVAILGVARPGNRSEFAFEPISSFPKLFQWGDKVWYEEPNIIWIHSNSAKSETYLINCSVCPKPDACLVDKRFSSEWYETLLDGVRSLVYALPGRSWFNLQIATEFKRRFAQGYQTNKIEMMTGKRRGRWRMSHERVM